MAAEAREPPAPPPTRVVLLALGLALGPLSLTATVLTLGLEREDASGVGLYVLASALVPLLVASVRIAFRAVTVIVVLVSLFFAAFGLVWLLPALVFQVAALFTVRPRLDRRSALAAATGLGVGVLAWALAVALARPERPDILVCVPGRADTNPIFDAVAPEGGRPSPVGLEGITRVPSGVLIEVDAYASDADVERIRRQAQNSIPGAFVAPTGKPCPGPV